MFEVWSLPTQRYNGSFIAVQFALQTLHFVLTIPLGIHLFLNLATRYDKLFSAGKFIFFQI